MREVRCKSGHLGWRSKLQKVYPSLESFAEYCLFYNLHVRLGYKTPKEAWSANPMCEGSVIPADFCKVHA
jgi:hypothetical protein